MEKEKIARKTTKRSETVSVRLEPKVRYLAELAARKQRRTLSSYIEWAVDDSLSRVTVLPANDAKSVAEEAGYLWDVEPADRLAKLAFRYEFLLNHEEQKLWKLIKENGYLWKGTRHRKQWTWTVSPYSLIYERLRANWDAFTSVARGSSSPDVLPKWEGSETEP